MTIAIILFSLFLIALMGHAFICATKDGSSIDQHERIDHSGNLKKRILFCAAVWLCVSASWLLAWPFGMGYMRFGFLLLVPMGFAWWTMCFRFFLNAMGDVAWHWMGPPLDARGPDESRYDTFWHWLAWVVQGRERAYMGQDFRGKAMYVRSYFMFLPAMLAYTTEAALFIASFLILFYP